VAALGRGLAAQQAAGAALEKRAVDDGRHTARIQQGVVGSAEGRPVARVAVGAHHPGGGRQLAQVDVFAAEDGLEEVSQVAAFGKAGQLAIGMHADIHHAGDAG